MVLLDEPFECFRCAHHIVHDNGRCDYGVAHHAIAGQKLSDRSVMVDMSCQYALFQSADGLMSVRQTFDVHIGMPLFARGQ